MHIIDVSPNMFLVKLILQHYNIDITELCHGTKADCSEFGFQFLVDNIVNYTPRYPNQVCPFKYSGKINIIGAQWAIICGYHITALAGTVLLNEPLFTGSVDEFQNDMVALSLVSDSFVLPHF